jgi:hypothetical protein
MLPVITRNNPSHVRIGDAKLTTDSSKASPTQRGQSANLDDVGGGQFSVPVTLTSSSPLWISVEPIRCSFRMRASAFKLFISSVIGVRSKKHVARVAALRVIAVMEHQLVSWINVVCEPKRNPRSGVDTLPYSDAAVSPRTTARCPRPALVSALLPDLAFKPDDVFRRERRQWSMISLSHWISFTDLVGWPRGVSALRGLFHFIEQLIKSQRIFGGLPSLARS